MKNLILFSFILLWTTAFLLGHENHQQHYEDNHHEHVYPEEEGGRPNNLLQWIGSFHFIFLHFPLALLTMTGLAEIMYRWNKKQIYEYASRFMLAAGAFLAVPTALFGLAYSYTVSYEGILANFLLWHMWLGLATAIFAVFTAFLRLGRGAHSLYYICLAILFILVSATGFFGGGMTWGPYHLLTPEF